MNLEPLLAAVPAATVEEEYDLVAVDVPAEEWAAAVTAARDRLGCSFLDFLSAVDESPGIRLVCHVVSPTPFGRLLLRALLPAEAPAAASVAHVYAGAAWHERETAEMFGVRFLGASGEPLPAEPLLLSPAVEGHPLRKEVLLRSRLERPWPGAKEPGESDADATQSRRRLRPPGVPEGPP